MARRLRSSTDHGRQLRHESGGSLRWLLTYADMITLLMAFFIMLYSMSILNLSRFREVAVSIRSGFGGMDDGMGRSLIGADGDLRMGTINERTEGGDVSWVVVKKIQKLINDEKLESSVKLRVDERGLVISLVTDKVVFAKGQADLSPLARRIIAGIADALKEVSNPVCVEGHTCDLPVSSERFPSNWELSTTRATNVVRFLIEQVGLPACRLSAAGYADSKPLAPNTSSRNRALNRRVDIIVLRDGYRDDKR